MRLVNRPLIEEFKKKHASARAALDNWVDVVEGAHWKNLEDVKQTFNSVDYVAPGYVFNVGGNNTRLFATITFEIELVAVSSVETHAEYSKQRKGRSMRKK